MDIPTIYSRWALLMDSDTHQSLIMDRPNPRFDYTNLTIHYHLTVTNIALYHFIL